MIDPRANSFTCDLESIIFYSYHQIENKYLYYKLNNMRDLDIFFSVTDDDFEAITLTRSMIIFIELIINT